MTPPAAVAVEKKKPISWINLGLGAGINIFEISTLGQPFEVLKTHMAANRGDGLLQAVRATYGRGGMSGFYQGLIPWAWIEAATKGAVLLFTASEIEYLLKTRTNLSAATGGILAGMTGGVAQAYTTMGFCTFMKTVEITRHKGASAGGAAAKTSLQIAGEIWRKEGIRGINRGVNAVALRQCTNWGSRIGLSRFAEDSIKRARGDHVDHSVPLSPGWKIVASTFGGALSCWNQPIEVIRVEMQSQIKSEGRPERMSIMQTSKWIYERNGIRGFFRGVIPRVGLGAWQTVCMVAGGDALKQRVKEWQEQRDAKGGKY